METFDSLRSWKVKDVPEEVGNVFAKSRQSIRGVTS